MLLKVENVGLDAVATCISDKCVTLEERLKDIADADKITRLKELTGFERFSIAAEGICASDYCAAAAEKLFDEIAIDRKEIRAVLFVSQTPDYVMPSTAHVLHDRLRLSRDAAAIDINLGCSGYVYGLYIAASMLGNLPDGKILLLCGDTPARNMFRDDISCQSIFGDGGSASILSKCDGRKMFFNLQTFGEYANAIIKPRGGYRKPLMIENNSIDVRENFVTMDGARIMEFSTRFVPPNLSELMEFAAVEPSTVELFLIHQANRLIVETIAERLALPKEKFPFRAQKIGNTSSASIPLVLTEMRRLNEPTKFLTVMSGFGVGMSIASAVVDLSDTIILPTGEF